MSILYISFDCYSKSFFLPLYLFPKNHSHFFELPVLYSQFALLEVLRAHVAASKISLYLS